MENSKFPVKKVIYTVNLGQYDRFHRIKVPEGWDFVYFVNPTPTFLERSRMGRRCQFRILDSENYPPRLLSRLPKIMPHRFFPEYDYSIYMDADVILLDDPTDLCSQLGWPKMATAFHPNRVNALDEIQECINRGRADLHQLKLQLEKYSRKSSYIAKAGLTHNSVIFRRVNDLDVIRISEAWWKQLLSYTHRDQASLAYICAISGFEVKKYNLDLRNKYFKHKLHRVSLMERTKKRVIFIRKLLTGERKIIRRRAG